MIPPNEKSPLAEHEQQEEVAAPSFLNFTEYRRELDALRKDWEAELQETERRRRIRKIEIDMETLRANGRLKADELLIGVRVIDENIKKEQPIFVNYLTQSRRLAVFDCRSNPTIEGVEILETEFTKGLSYDGMMKNLFKTIDGAQTHGWDSVEITYDPSKPLRCGIEHIGHENLMYATDAKDIQACHHVMRRFKISTSQLDTFVRKHGFSSAVAESIKQHQKNKVSNVPKNVEVFKVFIKHEDIVYVGWCSLDTNVDAWLKDPSPLSLGRVRPAQRTVMVDKQVTIPDTMTGMPTSVMIQRPEVQTYYEDEVESQYPIKVYVYSESEEQTITEQKGRVFFDLPWQEAQIALRSMFINGAMRASNVYGSPANKSDVGGQPKKMDLSLEHGCFYDQPMQFWGTQYPDPQILRAADALDVRKAAELGQTASAVINREDSRKTATELNKASEEQGKLNSVSVLLFSGFMRGVLGVAWYIVQNQALYGEGVIVAPLEIVIQGRAQVVNNPQLIGQVYDVKPAGDVDVVRRAERLEKRWMLLPIVQQIGGEVAFEFVRDLFREMLPEDSQKYINLLGQQQQQQQVIDALASMLKEAVTDETGNLKPEFKEFAPQFAQMQQILGGQQQQQPAR